MQILETNFGVLFIRMTTVNPPARTGSSFETKLVALFIRTTAVN